MGLKPRCTPWPCVLAALAACTAGAHAQTVDEEGDRIPGLPEPSIGSSLPKELGDLGGLRSHLARDGITFAVNYIGDAVGNPTGGFEQGMFYIGRLDLELKVDLEKMIGWHGLSFFTNGYWIHGESISAEALGVLMPVTFIEALPSVRLFELYLEQKLFADRLSIRLGQLAADSEFMISESAGAFLNATWGWPAIAGINNPDGGPAYPMAAPGVRVAIKPNDSLTLMTALYTGDPAEDCEAGSPQICNPHGLLFPFSDPLLFVEAAYSYNQDEGELAGTLKVGGWRLYSAPLQQSIGNNALPISLPAIPGETSDQDLALYVLLDQMVYRLAGSGDPRGISLFGRIIGAPAEGNMIELFWNAGITMRGLTPERPNDILGVGLAYTGVSSQISDYQIEMGDPIIADFEAMLEVSYTAEIVPGFYLQPDFQYFWNPGGRVSDFVPTQKVPDAAVLGLRTTINY